MEISIFNTFLDVVKNSASEKDKKQKLNRLFQIILDEALDQERIHFTSLFSKLAFLGVRFELQGKFLYELHQLRKRIEQPSPDNLSQDIQMLEYLIPHLTCQINGQNMPEELEKIIPKNSGINHKQNTVEKYISHTKLVCTTLDKKNKLIRGFLDEYPEILSSIEYNIPDRNERFTNSIEQLSADRLPIIIELIEVEKGADGILRPTAFVIEPDFLFDVTAVASCFNHEGTKTVGYLYKKFLPMSWSKPLLLGNVANYFLDRLVDNVNLTFEEIIKDVFQLDPLSFARIEDHEMNGIISDMRKHFYNIKQSLQNEFRKENINLANSYLEPSFMSAKYGIQGRLDLLHMDDDYTSIIELKSGSIFKPNVYGLKNDHYVQTLLYDLLIRSTFPDKKPRNYILYSKDGSRSLRIAPRIAAQQKEALRVRNELLELELSLASPEHLEPLLNTINARLYDYTKGFELTNITNFENRYQSLDRLEKDYFNTFVNFIALEHRLSKIGEYGQDKSNGLAGLWLDSHEEKCDQFNMVTELVIVNNQSANESPLITLKHTEDTNHLSNFREGDIVIFYPLVDGHMSSLRNQVFKCTIIAYKDEEVTIKLRSQQKNQDIFKENERWALEHDMMDSSFIGMYRQLYEWAGAPKDKRQLLLSRIGPRESESSEEVKTLLKNSAYDNLTLEQKGILHQMIQNQDYYLVWGPPGTGKTSRMISHYIKYMMDETDENLYVIAYTNRAVDELCEAICSLGQEYEDKFIRIGSSYGTQSKFVDKLLQSKIKGISRRKELREKVKSHRIVVATLASIISKEIIFQLIPSKRIILDEASQILEPNIVGLLSRFEQFILVGDHRQLPAVVVQPEEDSEVKNTGLKELGLVNRRDSFFERIYKQCLNNKWNHAIGQLQSQGRMHQDIMRFPNEQFYDDKLKTLDKLDRLTYTLQQDDKANIFQYKRMIFQQVDVPVSEKFSKTNSAEVFAVVDAVKKYIKLGYPMNEIGIITPFRAQIAAIKESLLKDNPNFIEIAVDTVERYQGAAKQVIIISFCCNSPIQFRSMISISSEGIDRKLNVALTRAKERVLIIGDEKILRKNSLYDQLIENCAKWIQPNELA